MKVPYGCLQKLIISHYENNYGGAVKRFNLINEQLAGINFSTAPGFLINGLKREQLRPPKTCAVSKHSHDRSPAGLRRFLGLQQQRLGCREKYWWSGLLLLRHRSGNRLPLLRDRKRQCGTQSAPRRFPQRPWWRMHRAKTGLRSTEDSAPARR